METSLTCNEALGVLVVDGTLPSFVTYKLLAEWLECYNYIPPKDRVLSPYAVNELTGYECANITNASTMFKVYLACNIFESCFTLREQNRLTDWIRKES